MEEGYSLNMCLEFNRGSRDHRGLGTILLPNYGRINGINDLRFGSDLFVFSLRQRETHKVKLVFKPGSSPLSPKHHKECYTHNCQGNSKKEKPNGIRMRSTTQDYRRKRQHPNHGAHGGSKEDSRDYHENRPHED